MRYVYCIHQSPHTCIVDNRHFCKKEGMFVFSEKGKNRFPRRPTCLLFGVLLKSQFLFTYSSCSPCVQPFMCKTLNPKLLRLGQHWAETTGRKLSDNQSDMWRGACSSLAILHLICFIQIEGNWGKSWMTLERSQTRVTSLSYYALRKALETFM